MFVEKYATKKGNGQSGYWKERNHFDVYFNGHYVGKFPTPEASQAKIDSLTIDARNWAVAS